ncbi:hypothetical protein ABLO27_24795 [Roseibium sp. SCPC15]|uniref:hypothetical protein n=1 Tax=Roseibium sp. SCP15 TaxID=3141376 RepID=UPI003335858E
MYFAPVQLSNLNDLIAHLREQIESRDLIIAGVCGLAGAGKTTLCKTLASNFPAHTLHLECDRFSQFSFVEREKRIEEQRRLAPVNSEENPLNWYAWEAIGRSLAALRDQGCFTYERAWNNCTGELDGKYSLQRTQDASTLVLCDGIYLLHEPVRDWLDMSILVDTPEAIRRARGKARTTDVDRRDCMERLERIYVIPYFETNIASADIIYRVADPA